MDNRPKRPPPVPKFQANKDTAGLEQKLTSFMNSLNSTPLQPKQKRSQQSRPNEMKSESAKEESKVQKKKSVLANINSKLNNMLNAKKINIANAITTEVQRQKKQQHRKIGEVQYDPQHPNSYELSKSNYIHLLSNHSDTESSQEDIKVIEKQPDIIEEKMVAEEEQERIEQKEEIALRMMQKFGYKVGQGLGKQSQGIKTPLIVRKTTDSSGIIELSSIPLDFLITPSISAKNALAAYNVQASQVIVLVGLLSLQQLQEGLEQQIKQQCCLYGIIVDWTLYLYNGQLRIYVQFQTKQQALNAFVKMNSKYFGQRLVSVRFYNKQNFKAKVLNNDLHAHIST